MNFAGSQRPIARDRLVTRTFTPRAKLRWCGGRRLFDRLQGWAVQSGHEPDRFGFWAVEELVDVRWPPRRRGRQLEALLRFCGCDPVSRAEWPMEWMPITWLKDDLKAVARRMEAEKVAAAAAAAATHATGRKRSWAGLGWDGADEGLPRRGRSAGMGERRAAEASAAAPPAADAAQAAVAALPLIEVCPLPAGGAPEGIAVVLAQPAGWCVATVVAGFATGDANGGQGVGASGGE